jgi:hypothetical protein
MTRTCSCSRRGTRWVPSHRQKVIRIGRDGPPVVDENAARKVLAEEVDSLPHRLAELKLLDLDYTPSARSPRTAG